jgi:3-mercaptopyruvate sulfurtransferase SseA
MKNSHISGAINLYYKDLINENDGTFKSDKAMYDIFTNAGIDHTRPVFCYS